MNKKLLVIDRETEKEMKEKVLPHHQVVHQVGKRALHRMHIPTHTHTHTYIHTHHTQNEEVDPNKAIVMIPRSSIKTPDQEVEETDSGPTPLQLDR